MQKIADFQGSLMNHLNTVYRPGEREAAIKVAEAIGLTVVELPLDGHHSMLAGHMNSDDPDILNNVVYFFEMSPVQAKLEEAMKQQIERDADLQEAVAGYHDIAVGRPDATPHIGLQLRSNAQLDAIKEKLANLPAELKDRVRVSEMPPYGSVGDFPDMRQIFVHTDVFTAGSGAMGQVIELQVERQLA